MKKHKGFTMIEMLVIVGCIAALVAIAYPKFSNMMEQNRENTDVVAMQSAQALLETAFDTGLLIDGKPVTDATADTPLYYDPSGKLTWQPPEGYGEGTDSPSGVTWSCCDDYEYNPAASYKGGIIYCYYVAPGAGVAYPGLHVHWSSDKDRPNNRPKPADPVPTITFPTVPAQSEEITEATGGDGGDDSKTDPVPDTNPKPFDPKNLGGHGWPKTRYDNTIYKHVMVSGMPLYEGHCYKVYDDNFGIYRYYISKVSEPQTGNVVYPSTPEEGMQWSKVTELTQDNLNNILTIEKNVDPDGRYFRVREDGTKDYSIGIGSIVALPDGNNVLHYYIKNTHAYSDVEKGPFITGNWTEMLACPYNCGEHASEEILPESGAE